MVAVEADTFFPVSSNLKQGKAKISIKDVIRRNSPKPEV